MRKIMNLEQQLNELTGKMYGKTIAACTDAQLYNSVLQLTKAGFFSSDRTIAEYNRDIWKLNN